jgi:hypothetical protein
MSSAPFRAPGMSLTAIDKIFDEVGPTPRLCFGTETSLTEHKRKALGKLTLSYLEDMAITHEYLALDAASRKMYMLTGSSVRMDSVEVDIVTISPFRVVASKIAARMRRHELVRLFNCYIALPSMREIIAGDIFEAYCLLIFSTKIVFNFIPMVRIDGQPQSSVAFESHQV